MQEYIYKRGAQTIQGFDFPALPHTPSSRSFHMYFLPSSTLTIISLLPGICFAALAPRASNQPCVYSQCPPTSQDGFLSGDSTAMTVLAVGLGCQYTITTVTPNRPYECYFDPNTVRDSFIISHPLVFMSSNNIGCGHPQSYAGLVPSSTPASKWLSGRS